MNDKEKHLRNAREYLDKEYQTVDRNLVSFINGKFISTLDIILINHIQHLEETGKIKFTDNPG